MTITRQYVIIHKITKLIEMLLSLFRDVVVVVVMMVFQYQTYQIHNEVDTVDEFEKDNHELRLAIQFLEDH